MHYSSASAGRERQVITTSAQCTTSALHNQCTVYIEATPSLFFIGAGCSPQDPQCRECTECTPPPGLIEQGSTSSTPLAFWTETESEIHPLMRVLHFQSKYVCLFYLNYYLAVGLNGTNKPARHYNLAAHIAYCYYRCQQNTGYIDTCPRPNNAQNDPPKSAFHRNVAQFALEYNTLTKHSLSFCSKYSVHQFSLAIKYSPPS